MKQNEESRNRSIQVRVTNFTRAPIVCNVKKKMHSANNVPKTDVHMQKDEHGH